MPRLVMGLVCFCACLVAAIACGQPNIVLILADDLGWTDLSGGRTNLGFSSDFYETPNLDTLAAEGTAFTNAYSAGATCTPTRAAILSGQYAPRPTNHLYAVSNLNRTNGQVVPLVGPEQGLPGGASLLTDDAITIAETLQTAQYRTAHLGKWSIGSTTGATAVLNQGFDVNFGGTRSGTPASYHAVQTATGWEFDSKVGPDLDAYATPYTQTSAPDPSLVGTPKHVTDALTEAAVDFMEANKSQPFFVNFSHYAVHIPIDNAQARSDLLAKYQAKQPGSTGHNRASYAALVEGIDQSVGEIVEYLETTDDPRYPGSPLSANTLVVFYSDNGGVDGLTNNDPLQGGKQELTEGGLRVPMIAWMPGRVQAGVINDTPITSVDLYTTFTDLAGADRPENYILDGENLMPILEDEAATLTRDAIYWHLPGYYLMGTYDQRPQSIIRKGDFKLIHNYEYAYDATVPEFELYDVASTDLGETNNLSDTMPELATAMAQELALWLWDTGAELPLDAVTSLPVDYPGQRTADMNGDEKIDFDDITTFVQALNDGATYQTEYGVPAELRGDTNKNRRFDFDDIAGFVTILNGGFLGGSVQSVPEPSTLQLLTAICLFGLVACGCRRPGAA